MMVQVSMMGKSTNLDHIANYAGAFFLRKKNLLLDSGSFSISEQFDPSNALNLTWMQNRSGYITDENRTLVSSLEKKLGIMPISGEIGVVSPRNRSGSRHIYGVWNTKNFGDDAYLIASFLDSESERGFILPSICFLRGDWRDYLSRVGNIEPHYPGVQFSLFDYGTTSQRIPLSR